MKTHALKILMRLAVLLMFAGSFVSCKEKAEYEPKEIPFTEYSLEGTSCQWTGFEPNTVIIINNNEDLENRINCTADSSPEIDFSKKTLLLVLVNDVAGCNIDSRVEKLLLKQLSASNYELSIEISPSITANAAPFFRYIAVITEKLGEESTVGLNVTAIKI